MHVDQVCVLVTDLCIICIVGCPGVFDLVVYRVVCLVGCIVECVLMCSASLCAMLSALDYLTSHMTW